MRQLVVIVGVAVFFVVCAVVVFALCLTASESDEALGYKRLER